jgi:hypothetical protein
MIFLILILLISTCAKPRCGAKPNCAGSGLGAGPGNRGLVEAPGPSNRGLAGAPGLRNLKHKILSVPSLKSRKTQKK